MRETGSPELMNKVAGVRQQLGFSAAELAKAVGVSRQTIYAIEAGSYMPNTQIGLRLARALQVSVENLFVLTDGSTSKKSCLQSAAVVPLKEKLQAGQPVRLSRVAGKLVATNAVQTGTYFTTNDGLVCKPNRSTSVQVEVHQPEQDFSKRVLLAGCDPAMGLLAVHLLTAGLDVVLLHQNSSQSLSLLKAGLIHIAGSHLRDEHSDELNTGAVRKLFPTKSARLISFAFWQEGLIVAKGNPKDIRKVEDLGRRDVSLVNREPGAGARTLLDSLLKRQRIPVTGVKGYDRVAPGHLAAAWDVKAGQSDCCLSTEACARSLGLDFVPLQSARYDLIVQKQQLNEPALQVFFNAVNQLPFRKRLQDLGGYDTSVMGNQVDY